MDFLSPTNSDPSVLAQDVGEQDFLFDETNTPEPVLASTAHKDKAHRELMGRIQQLAGSYMDTVSSGSGSEKRESNGEKDFQFLDFLKSSLSNSSASGRSMSPTDANIPKGSQDSSLSMLDLDAMSEPGSLVHVDSNVSLGSWFGDFMPEKGLERPSIPAAAEQSIPRAVCEGPQPEVIQTPGGNQSSAEHSKLLPSRYLMSDSQLGFTQYSESPLTTPVRSFAYSRREEPEGEASVCSGNLTPTSDKAIGHASSEQSDAFALSVEENAEIGNTLDFSGPAFQQAADQQQGFFDSEQFDGDAAEVLDKDEEIFEEEHKLMIHSGDAETFIGSGFTTVTESQLKFSPEPKMSIGTYMAARSGRMGNLGEIETSVERPSFGLKIRTPSPRKPYPLQESKLEDTYIGEDASKVQDENTENGNSGVVTSEPELSKRDETLEAEPHDNDRTQDVTLEPSTLSLSEAIMNMSTSINNEELARAIIEISNKKKQEKLDKAEKKRQSTKNESSEDQLRDKRSSKVQGQHDEAKQIKRGSRIPIGTKSPSPPKPVRMSYQKKNSTFNKSTLASKQKQVGQRLSSDKREIQRPSTSGSNASRKSSTKIEKPPLKSVENLSSQPKRGSEPSSGGKKLDNVNVENAEPVSIPKSVASEEEQLQKNWDRIMQESFMQDAPEHDEVVEKSAASEQDEELPTFNSGTDSVCFPDEVASKYFLSSTRTDVSLLRGSISRESIIELHKKLRAIGENRSENGQSTSSPIEKTEDEKNEKIGVQDDACKDKAENKLEEDKTWKNNDVDSHDSLAQPSPDWKSTRYSGEFHQMLPSMSFGEMATIQEHQFDLGDLEEGKNDDVELSAPPQIRNQAQVAPKLDVIKEEDPETTQDTTLSGQSTASGDSQLTTEIPHPKQHSTLRPQMPTMIHPPPSHLYPTVPHVIYRHPHHPSTSLPGAYSTDIHYRHVDGAGYHTLPPEFSHHRTAPIYPHSFGAYPLSGTFAHHPVLHSTTTPLGYAVEQPSLASSADVGLNHTTSTMYAQGYHSGVVHAPRSATLDGRFPAVTESYYHPPQQVALSVPQELEFCGVRCVCLQSFAKLPLTNKSDRWLQVELNIVSPAIDCCFSLDAKPLVGPHDTKNVEISFSPKKEGKFEALLEVISYPVTSEGSTLQPTRSASAMVNLKAEAENANAEFLGPENSRVLHFGETLCETSKYLPLRIFNKGAADIPVCIILCTKSQDRKCFALSDSSNLEWNDQDKRAQSILRTVVHPGDRVTTVWVHCKIPPKYSDAAEPPKTISAQVYMEIDNSQKQSLDTVVLDTISAEVIACVAKLHAPKNMQPLNFSCPRDSSQTRMLPVKNCGNVSSRVTFSLSEEHDIFTISPQHALLAPGEHIQVSIQFRPVRFTPGQLNSTFLMKIEPNGTKYEVLINATCSDPDLRRSSRSSFPDSSSTSVHDMPSLLTNKSHVCWGGVPVGHSLQQRVVLRTSNGARKPLPMRLMIKGEDATCFQILKEDEKDQEELCSKQEIVMQSGQDKIVKILFGPTKCKMALAKLEIKAPVDQVPSTKFTIPLSGYGGKSEVKVEGLELMPKEDDSTLNLYCANAEIVNDTKFQAKFMVRNNSSRHAFIKAMMYSDQVCQVVSGGTSSCSPSQFVLPKHKSQIITAIIEKPTYTNRTSYSRNGKELAASICLWHGDETGRHLLKNALAKLGPSAINKSLSESNPLRNVPFDGIFEGEGSQDPEEDLSQVKPQLGDVQVFYNCMKKTVIQVFGPPSTTALLEMVEPGKKCANNTMGGEKSASSHMHYKRSNQDDSSGDSWQLSPEHVILSAPRINRASDPSKIKIINRSSTPLKFDVAWSGHYLTITPHSGQVDPESVLIMLLSANPSLASRRDLLPWLGAVQVTSQNGRGTKQLRVQIRDDVASHDASVQPATPVPRLALKARYSEMSTTDSFATPAAASGVSRISGPTRDSVVNKILLESATVDFGQTVAKASAKSQLEFTNICPSSIRWLLTSFAPAYVKDIEPTGDLYRSTYAAFVFSHTSGLLEPGAKVRIPVTFNPMSEGSYSQFWDLEHHEAADSAAISLNKLRIQVIGQGVKSNRTTQANAHPVTTKSKEGNGIYVSDDRVRFPDISVNESTIVKIPVKNRSKESHSVRFINVRPPFHITHQRHTIRPMSYACLPVTFKPTTKGEFEGNLVIQTEGTFSLTVKLMGRGI